MEGEEIPDKNKNKHSKLEEVIEMVSHSNVKHLILGHFSSRYSQEQIDQEVKRLKHKYNIHIPVSIIYPGAVKRVIV